MKRNLLIIAALTVLSVGASQATLIDNDVYTTDTETGLDWLDWSATVGLTGQQALDANIGWRYAEASETSSLLASSFSFNFYNPLRPLERSESRSSIRAFDSFNALFGSTNLNESVPYDQTYTRASVFGGGITGVIFYDYKHHFYGTDAVVGYDMFHTAVDHTLSESDYLGVALVRSTADVPEPATLGLLVLGLSGIGLSRRRRS
jgi:hypothetical protein